MKDRFKLKHLDIILDEEKKDIAILMVDILGYKNSIFGKAKFFVKNFNKIKTVVAELENLDFETIPLNKDCHIKHTYSIDDISYLAMLNLKGMIDNSSDLSMSNYIANVIGIATYSENRFSKYKPDSKSFKSYVNSLMEINMFDMIGLYTHILKDLEETSKSWNERFMSVEVIDKDLENAGGSGLHQFNVVNTIKALCNDFNITNDEAMYTSYNLVMTNNYSKAYAGFIQENIRIKKEQEYLAKNKN